MKRSTLRVRRRAGLLLGLAVCLSGCRGDVPRGDDALQQALTVANEPEVCTLLSDAEIEDVLGATPGPPDKEVFEDAVMCTWRSSDDVAVQLVSITITRAIAYSYAQYLEKSEELLGYPATAAQAQLVEGPGRFNVWVPDAADAERGAFQMFVAGYMIQIVAPPAGERTALQTCAALAVLIDQRLP